MISMSGYDGYQVRCQRCGASINPRWKQTYKTAAEKWNKRYRKKKTKTEEAP